LLMGKIFFVDVVDEVDLVDRLSIASTRSTPSYACPTQSNTRKASRA